jgi:GR25 family glycosyltransferase involved in LPS biosynthesis
MPQIYSNENQRLWNYFDRVYCISLADRTDRREQCQSEFQSVGLGERVEYVLVHRDTEDCERSIYNSHLSCIAQGLSTDADNILIFEDDVIFRGFNSEQLSECIDFLQEHTHWKAFFFGCMVRRSCKTSHPAVQAISYRNAAHAYAVNKPFAKEILAKPYRGVPYDTMLSRFNDGFYAAYPTFAFQSDSPSDNTRHKTLDRFRRWCGGLVRIQKANEWSNRHRRALVVWHVVVLVGLVVLVLWISR